MPLLLLRVGGVFEKVRVVAFATAKGLEMLENGKKWYLDVTSICPKLSVN